MELNGASKYIFESESSDDPDAQLNELIAGNNPTNID